MPDRFEHYTASLEAPPSGGRAIIPSDEADFAVATRGLNVGASGAVHLTTVDGSDLTLQVAPGIVFPIRARRIWATGTTALDIVGLY
jgi:hypothetical protein